jgi:hypothetical protein
VFAELSGAGGGPDSRVCVVRDDEIGFVSGHFVMPGETMVKAFRCADVARTVAPVPRCPGIPVAEPARGPVATFRAAALNRLLLRLEEERNYAHCG